MTCKFLNPWLFHDFVFSVESCFHGLFGGPFPVHINGTLTIRKMHLGSYLLLIFLLFSKICFYRVLDVLFAC